MTERFVAEREFERRVNEERERQDVKWGVQTHGGHAWCGILLEEVGEFAKAVNDGDLEGAERELVQVAAVCRAAYAQSRVSLSLHGQWGTFDRSQL